MERQLPELSMENFRSLRRITVPLALTGVEEVEGGLHPQALELVADRLREVSEPTQFLIATHSLAPADRLRPEELIVCDRRDDGSSVIPAVSEQQIEHVLLVWEMEAWLLLFLDALTDVVKSWKVPAQYRNRDIGSLSDPKKILMQKISGSGQRYRESDAPDVLVQTVALGSVDRPEGSNSSWQQFHTDAVDCCRTHIGSRGKTR